MYRWLLGISLIALLAGTFTSGTVSEILIVAGVTVGELLIWIIENLKHKIETLEEQIKEMDNNGKIH